MQKKEKEIKSKEEIIKSFEEEEDSSTDEESQDDEKGEDHRLTEASSLTIGQGYFRKEFEVRDGMEEEAASLRREWTNK